VAEVLFLEDGAGAVLGEPLEVGVAVPSALLVAFLQIVGGELVGVGQGHEDVEVGGEGLLRTSKVGRDRDGEGEQRQEETSGWGHGGSVSNSADCVPQNRGGGIFRLPSPPISERTRPS